MDHLKLERNIKNIVFLGLSDISINLLDFLKKKTIKVKILISKREYDSIKNNNLKKIVSNKNIIEKISNLENSLSSYKTDTIIFSVGSNFIISDTIIEKFSPLVFNCHNTFLPMWRGGGDISYRIMNSDRVGATSVHFVTNKIDKGDLILQKKYNIPASKNNPIKMKEFIENRALSEIKKLLNDLLNKKKIKVKKLKKQFSSYFPRLKADIHGHLDWSWSCKNIKLFIKAFSHPYNGAFCFLEKRKIRIFDCEIIKSKKYNHPFMYGIIYRVDKNNYFVAAKGGVLKILKKDVVSNGKIKLGDKFYTNYASLQKLGSKRVFYSPSGISSIG